ncbi:unnamed protein product [Rotaria socialis]|uniref:BTB domain-containing protein n=1 Tax=Rotaria socialis TaxID=392032 RepID=A0A817ZSZ8_9BILA|nr:unnamed protein product [Rotaria socialis]CAF3359535.1 unnamed protein product [Rotaria socialis]CAF3396802.1 unnamed protein product [Rotaria socialis]CAF3413533.1 unnamed protein product [Rotaria socialis]CAF4188920.1 unnamed protein product [Rotaria socialis]
MAKLDITSLGWKQKEQWVSRVIGCSSQYNNDTWSANQIIGPPKVYPRYGDITGAWAQGSRAGDEFIVVEFEEVVYPERIDIYETYNSGAVVKVLARNGKVNSEWETVWKTETPQIQEQSRIFSISCTNICEKEINQIRLNIDCTAARRWCEIDCIKLIGFTSNVHLFSNEFLADLSDLLTNDYLSDVIFQLDNEQLISSYRNILSNRCIYFHELFIEYPSNRTEPIPIRNISYKAFNQILHFIFTDNIEPTITYDICLELMRKADEYFLSLIYTKAFDILKKIIDKTNVLKILIQSGLDSVTSNENQHDNFLLNDVIDLCIVFIKKNRRDIYLNENMQILSKDMLLKLVQLDL